ncbi:hypothetical protein CG709_01930, partial [Lachnotalea glycerini]
MKRVVLIVNVLLLAFICVFYIVKIDQNQYINCKIGTPKVIHKIETNANLTTENILQTLIFNGESLPYDT